MTTAREQAREAAVRAVPFPDIRHGYPNMIREMADAASDVWEPLVKHLIAVGDALVRAGTFTKDSEEVFQWIKSVADIEEDYLE